MDKSKETHVKIDALMCEVSNAERLINAEVARAARENRELDPQIMAAVDKLEKTKKLIEALQATLESIDKLFMREVDTVKK